MNIVLAVIMFFFVLSISDYRVYLAAINEKDPVSLGSETIKSFPYLYYYDEKDSELTNSFILELDGKYFQDKDELQSFLATKYNEKIKLKLFSFQLLRIVEADLMLNGDSVVSNLDADVSDSVFITSVAEGSIAAEAGLEPNDVIFSLAGNEINSTDDLIAIRDQYRGETIELQYISTDNGVLTKVDLQIPDVADPILGITMSDSIVFVKDWIIAFDYSENKAFSGFSHTLNMAIYNVAGISSKVVESFQKRSLEPVSSSVGSIVAVTDITYSFVKVNDFKGLLDLTAMLNVVLAIMNILPIPLLDGGHILFIIIEKFRGRPLSAEKQEKIGVIAFWGFVIFSIVVVLKDVISLEWPTRIYEFITQGFK